jgi:hypothetical protein
MHSANMDHDFTFHPILTGRGGDIWNFYITSLTHLSFLSLHLFYIIFMLVLVLIILRLLLAIVTL